MTTSARDRTSESPARRVLLAAMNKRQKGLTTVEYAVAGALVAATLVTAFSDLGDQIAVVINGLTSDIGG